MDMGSRLEILLSVLALFFTAISVADDDSGLCKMVSCGKGRCNLTSSGGLIGIKTPHCNCDPGWKKPSIIGVSITFLPCVIPNCTFDASCSKKPPSSAPLPEPSPDNSTALLHPCKFALCGEGSCHTTSNFGYRCSCQAGYENLLNMTAGPCVRECKLWVLCWNRMPSSHESHFGFVGILGSLGADCSSLGLNVGRNKSTSKSPPPAQADTSSGNISSNNKGVGKSFPCQIAMAVLSLCVLLLYR